MRVLIDNRQKLLDIKDVDENFINDVVKTVMDFESCETNYELSISLVDNDEIKVLNKKYRGKDNATDVLSFPMIDFNKKEEKVSLGNQIKMFNNVETEIPLGDIVISVRKAHEQSHEYGHSFQREFAFLIIHGMLHLLGYDHEEKEDESVMLRKQNMILEALNIVR